MKRITIHNLATSTAQQVFDFVAAHLLKQNEKCQAEGVINGPKACFYRVETGNKKKVNKCAAGVLIPRCDYTPDMERKNWHSWLHDHADLVGGERLHQKLIEHLQDAHDNYSTSEWAQQLRRVAAKHELAVNFSNI
jgi:hypothetical protein